MREVKEELDFDLKDYLFFKEYHCTEGDVHKNIKYVYIGKMDKPVSELTLKVGEDLKFFSPHEIPKVKLANILKNIVMDYIDSRVT